MLKVLKQGRPNFWFPCNVGLTTITWVFKKCKSCICWSVRMFYLLKYIYIYIYFFFQITSDVMSRILQSLLLGRFDLGAMTYIFHLCLKLKLNFIIFIEHISSHKHARTHARTRTHTHTHTHTHTYIYI